MSLAYRLVLLGMLISWEPFINEVNSKNTVLTVNLIRKFCHEFEISIRSDSLIVWDTQGFAYVKCHKQMKRKATSINTTSVRCRHWITQCLQLVVNMVMTGVDPSLLKIRECGNNFVNLLTIYLDRYNNEVRYVGNTQK